MTPKVLFWSSPERWRDYREALPEALAEAGVTAEVGPDIAPEAADYLVYAPAGSVPDFARCGRLTAVLSLWAGVETLLSDVPADLPLTRMVDEGLTRGMVEYVAAHVLRHHLGIDAHIVNPRHEWRKVTPPLAGERRVTVLGLGALGAACATTLAGLGFRVTGWSRGGREVPEVTCLGGAERFGEALSGAEIVVLLLPHTPQTDGILDADALSRLAPGAVVINPGRGGLVDDDALLAALHSGRLGHATLDTFRTEPLPPGHPYWSHPRVTVTPHIASETRPRSASLVIAENIRRAEAGLPLLHLVDRAAGY